MTEDWEDCGHGIVIGVTLGAAIYVLVAAFVGWL